MMRTDLNELRTFLLKEYEQKFLGNKQYSKNAFARDLQISATSLNEFLNGKRDLSFANIESIFQYLNAQIHCSWCDKPQAKVEFLVGGPRQQYICNECIGVCNDIVSRNRQMACED